MAEREIPPGGRSNNSDIQERWRRGQLGLCVLRHLALGGTRQPPGGLGAGSAWRHVSPARQFILLQLRILIVYL